MLEMNKIDAVFEERQYEIGSEIMKGQEYHKLLKKTIEIFNQITEMLPENGKKLIHQLDEIECEKASIETEYLYRKAFADGIKFFVRINGGGV